MPNNTDIVTYFGSVSADLIVLVASTMLLAAFGIAKGKRFLIALALALYPGTLMISAFPYYDMLSSVGQGAALPRLTVFAVTVVLFAFFISRFTDGGFARSGFWRFAENVVLAVAIVGMVAAVFMQVIGIETIYPLSPLARELFASPTAYFLWLLAPLVALAGFVRA